MSFILVAFKDFFGKIFGLITGYPMQAAIIALFLSSAYLTHEVSSLKTQLTTAKKDNQTFADANGKLNGQISVQNKSIQTLKSANDAYARQIATAQKNSDAMLAAAKAKFDELKKTATPKTCDGAMQRLLDDAIAGHKP